jgi:hypothetical protein
MQVFSASTFHWLSRIMELYVADQYRPNNLSQLSAEQKESTSKQMHDIAQFCLDIGLHFSFKYAAELSEEVSNANSLTFHQLGQKLKCSKAGFKMK